MEFEKRTILTPAWDQRDADPSKDYGIHSVELKMQLIGEHGAVSFLLYTGWLLPESLAHPYSETKTTPEPIYLDWNQKFNYEEAFKRAPAVYPMPADLGYHSKKPMYEDQMKLSNCDLVEGGCYYDGSGLNAIPMFDTLLREGSDGVWIKLEEYYKEVFLTNER